MSEQRYRVTITLKAEDLTREGGEDSGSSAVIVNNNVSAETRHLIEKGLSLALVKWGDSYQEKKSGES